MTGFQSEYNCEYYSLETIEDL